MSKIGLCGHQLFHWAKISMLFEPCFLSGGGGRSGRGIRNMTQDFSFISKFRYCGPK